jgi:hypothetical protein
VGLGINGVGELGTDLGGPFSAVPHLVQLTGSPRSRPVSTIPWRGSGTERYVRGAQTATANWGTGPTLTATRPFRCST